MNFVYPAIISKTDNGYHARFPDLEMCEANGPTLDPVWMRRATPWKTGLGQSSRRMNR